MKFPFFEQFEITKTHTKALLNEKEKESLTNPTNDSKRKLSCENCDNFTSKM